MEKFANKEEQAEWFLTAHKRDDVKLLDEVNTLLNCDCGDFKLFLRDKILPDSEFAYRTFMGVFLTMQNSIFDTKRLNNVKKYLEMVELI